MDRKEGEKVAYLEEKPLITQAKYIRILGGDIYEAIILQQAIYWTSDKRGHLKPDGYYWFYKKAEDWHAELCGVLSVDRIRRKLRHLEKIRLLKTTSKFNKLRFDRTKWYTVDQDKLAEMLKKDKSQIRTGKNCHIEQGDPAHIEQGETPTCTTTGETDKNNVENAHIELGDPAHIEVGKTPTSEQGETPTSELGKKPTPITRDYSETTTKITNNVEQARHNTPKQKESPSQETATVIEYLNEKAGKHYRATTTKTKRLVAARLNEGFTVDDFKTVIDNKVADWTGTKWAEYLRPETLFGTKFEGYLNSTPRNYQPQNNTSWDATMTADGDFISSQPKGDEMIADEDLPFAT